MGQRLRRHDRQWNNVGLKRPRVIGSQPGDGEDQSGDPHFAPSHQGHPQTWKIPTGFFLEGKLAFLALSEYEGRNSNFKILKVLTLWDQMCFTMMRVGFGPNVKNVVMN